MSNPRPRVEALDNPVLSTRPLERSYYFNLGKQAVKRSLMRRRGFEPFIRFVPEAFSAAAAALGSGRDREQTAEHGTLEQSVKERAQNGLVEGSDIDEEGQHSEDRKRKCEVLPSL